ncbi:MAG TPA: hypothetical protein VKA54_23235 [Gemmatimonadaceae bacterium]|nr:hypothetical protein [Gemmatimonadaceae bacterium]
MSVRTGTLAAMAIMLAAVACDRGGDAGSGPYAREVAEAIPRIEQATGLKFKSPPKVEARTREQVRDFLLKQFDEATPAAQLAGEEKAYKLLGLIPDSMNLRAFFVRVLTEQVVGYYDPKAKTLYVVSGADEQVVGITITHELIHALQDQYVNLDSIQKSGANNDRLAAAQALIEGEAQFEQISIMLGGPQQIETRLPGAWDRVREEIRNRQGEMPVFATAPMVIQESLLFPYLSGAEFVRRVKEKRGNANPFRDIPRSTEQILHPPLFLGTPPDEPTPVVLPVPRGATKAYENDMGEFGTRLVVYDYLRDPQIAQRAAAGWDGDRFMVVERGADRGFVWALVWDSPVDAAEFTDAMVRATMRRTGAAERSVGKGVSYTANGRTISIQPVSVADRALVLYSNLPENMGSVIDPTAITLGK